MLYNLYSIYDRLAEEYGPVFQAKNNAVAVRAFLNEDVPGVRRDEYNLVQLGTYDTEKGVLLGIVPTVVPVDLKADIEE